MSVRRVGCLAAMVISMVLWSACGQVYRPVVIPCTTGGVPGCPVEPNPHPSNFHSVFGITVNTPYYPGGALQIDVSGDSIVGETATSTGTAPNAGFNPTHGIILSNDSKVFVATAASIFPGGVDAIASFSPVFQTSLSIGLGPVSTASLPSLANQSSVITGLSEAGNVVTVTLAGSLLANSSALVPVGTSVAITGESIGGYNGTFAITSISATNITYTDSVTGLGACAINTTTPCTLAGTASIPAQPVFLASSEVASVYVADFNSSSVAKLNTTTNVVTNTASVEPATYATGDAAANPIAMVEASTPNGFKLYVANQGNNTISSLNTVDLSPNTVTGFTGIDPVWVVVRGDSQKVYVVTQGDGQLVTIDTATDTVSSSLPVGVGANYVFYDPNLNRLYVTNPATAQVYVFADTGGVDGTGALNDTPVLLTPSPLTVPGLTAGSKPLACSGCGAVIPVSVAALLDGTRFYVASYQTATPCSDPNVTVGGCIVPSVTVFDANTLTVKYPTAPTMSLLTWPPFATNQFALSPVTTCAPTTLYTPISTRFRVFTTASEDSSRVYVSMCDAGTVAVINTTDSNSNNPGTTIPPDTLVTNLVGPYSDGPALASGEPAFQSPIFLFMGQ
jgi:YVTN family beta-propeller protein